jgi:hypothetical protein
MFCPQCAAKNEIEQSFCRQCGQPLEIVALALKGNFEEALTEWDKGYDSLVGGVATFGIFLLIATIVFFFGSVWSAAVNIGLGLIISLPFIIKGIWRIESASAMLEMEKRRKELPSTKKSEALPPASFTTDSLIVPASVTEQTTRELAQSEKKRK